MSRAVQSESRLTCHVITDVGVGQLAPSEQVVLAQHCDSAPAQRPAEAPHHHPSLSLVREHHPRERRVR
eukprot:2148153-Rhodomonas_salina.1